MPADPCSDTDTDGTSGRSGWTPLTPQTALRPLQRFVDRTGIGWRAALVVVAGLAMLVGGVVVRSGQASTPVPERTASPTAASIAAVPTSGVASSGPSGTASASATAVVVHVVGAVTTPGLVQLPAGSRVADAVSAAGGATTEADLSRVNLARLVTDGEQVVIPRPGEQVAAAPASGGPAGAPSASGGAPVNLNTADAAALDSLPGIGPVLAERIIAFRTDNGPFTSVDDLGEVSGIGERLLDQLRPLVAV
jgi:competence protein ComEA